MMKTIIYIFLVLLLAACTPQENYKDLRNDVVTIHDKVMTDGELLTKNRIGLDSLAINLQSLKKADPAIDTAEQKKQINALLLVLRKDEKLMDEWMQAFQADVQGKSNNEAVAYFKKEKQKIQRIDSIYKRDTRKSGEFLKGLLK